MYQDFCKRVIRKSISMEYAEFEERTRKIRRKLCIIEPLKWIIYNLLSTILPYLYIAFVLNEGEAQTAAYIAMIPALSTLSWRTSDAVELIVALVKESAFVNNLREFLSYEPKVNASELIKAKNLSDIEIKDMSFTYEGADRIILLENGSIAESGTHSELLSNGGTYAEMWNVQAEKYCASIYA